MPFTRERFAPISDSERWTTNVAQRKTHVKCDFKEHTCFVHDVKTYVFLNGEGLQNLILGIFTTKMLPKLCKSLICLVWLEMWFILLAISLINKSRDPFPFIYRLLENVRNDPMTRLFERWIALSAFVLGWWRKLPGNVRTCRFLIRFLLF